MMSRLVCSCLCGALWLSGCGKVASETIERAAGRAAGRRAATAFSRDLERDAASKLIRLQRERHVYKFTTESQARKFAREGFPPSTHFTASGSVGRPLSGAVAKKRYGHPMPQKAA